MRLLLIAACLLVWNGYAVGSERLLIWDVDTDSWKKTGDNHSVSFQGPKLKFKYIISRDLPEDRKPGAILVRVIRKYDPSWNKISDLEAITSITRNDFPQKNKLKDGQVRRPLYEMFHHNQIENLFLRHDFHATFPINQHTNEPKSRRSSFLFSNPYKVQTTHRAYLLYYKGILPEGTHIPFNVGISSAFERVLITVVELDPIIGVGFVPIRTDIMKK